MKSSTRKIIVCLLAGIGGGICLAFIGGIAAATYGANHGMGYDTTGLVGAITGFVTGGSLGTLIGYLRGHDKSS